MKKKLTILFMLVLFQSYGQSTVIPDANFEQALIDLGLDTILDGMVLTSNINAVDSLSVSHKNIANLTGIEDFDALTFLLCGSNQMDSLNLSMNQNLKYLDCQGNPLTKLILSGASALESLGCSSTLLTSLDLSQNSNLKFLTCTYTPLTVLDLSANLLLIELECHHNQLTSLNIHGLNSLVQVDCRGNTDLTSLQITQNQSLTHLTTHGNPLTSLDISGAPNLTNLLCDSNQLTTIDFSNNPELYAMRCCYSSITSLDFSHNPNLVNLFCHTNNLNCVNLRGTSLYFLDLTMNPYLSCIEVDDVNYANSNWSSDIPPTATFSTNCNNGCTNGLENVEYEKKQLIRIVDAMGRKTENEPNTILIYVYSDGTTEKMFQIE